MTEHTHSPPTDDEDGVDTEQLAAAVCKIRERHAVVAGRTVDDIYAELETDD